VHARPGSITRHERALVQPPNQVYLKQPERESRRVIRRSARVPRTQRRNRDGVDATTDDVKVFKPRVRYPPPRRPPRRRLPPLSPRHLFPRRRTTVITVITAVVVVVAHHLVVAARVHLSPSHERGDGASRPRRRRPAPERARPDEGTPKRAQPLVRRRRPHPPVRARPTDGTREARGSRLRSIFCSFCLFVPLIMTSRDPPIPGGSASSHRAGQYAETVCGNSVRDSGTAGRYARRCAGQYAETVTQSVTQSVGQRDTEETKRNETKRNEQDGVDVPSRRAID